MDGQMGGRLDGRTDGRTTRPTTKILELLGAAKKANKIIYKSIFIVFKQGQKIDFKSLGF